MNQTELEKRSRFHEPHLARVSRSFAYGISRLDLKLRADVGLAYLICRVLDTIEDAPWTSLEKQTHSFKEFASFLQSVPAEDRFQNWVQDFPKSINDGERELVREAGRLFSEVSELPADDKAVLLAPVLSMSRGMQAFAALRDVGGELRLRTPSSVNTYCFFVAGVVGELLTGLVAADLKPFGLKKAYVDGTHFGLFLQKINVLKDQWGDQREGRFLVPDRIELLASLEANAEGAFAYLESVPTSRNDYRLFCAWALYLGLATIPLLKASTPDESPAKLSRLSAGALAAKIEFAIGDSTKLKKLFVELKTQAWPVVTKNPATTSSADESFEIEPFLRKNYSGQIPIESLTEILKA